MIMSLTYFVQDGTQAAVFNEDAVLKLTALLDNHSGAACIAAALALEQLAEYGNLWYH
jgi:hypothetical protein